VVEQAVPGSAVSSSGCWCNRTTRPGPRIPIIVFARVRPAFVTPRAPHRSSRRRVGPCELLVQLNGLNILADPMWSERPRRFDSRPRRWVAPGIALDDLRRSTVVVA